MSDQRRAPVPVATRPLSAGRVALLVCSLALVACLSIQLRDTLLQGQATKIVSRSLLGRADPSAMSEAKKELTRARFLNPDRGVDLLIAYLDFTEGRVNQATGLIDAVIANEPRNLQAWRSLQQLGRATGDEQLITRAQAAISLLVRQ